LEDSTGHVLATQLPLDLCLGHAQFEQLSTELGIARQLFHLALDGIDLDDRGHLGLGLWQQVLLLLHDKLANVGEELLVDELTVKVGQDVVSGPRLPAVHAGRLGELVQDERLGARVAACLVAVVALDKLVALVVATNEAGAFDLVVGHCVAANLTIYLFHFLRRNG